MTFTEIIGTLGQSQDLLQVDTQQGRAYRPIIALAGSSGALLNIDINGGIVSGRNWFLDKTTDSVTAWQGTSPWIIQQSSVGSSVTAHLDAPISVTATATTTAKSTAADPSYGEGADSPLSQDLSGHIRTLASVTVPTPLAVSQSSGSSLTPWFVKQSDNPWIVNQTTSVGVFAQQAGSWSTGRTWSLASSGDSILAHLDAPISISSISVSNFPSNQNVTITNSAGVSASQAGIWTTGRTWTLASGGDSVLAHVDNFPATQVVNQGTTPWVISQSSVGTVLVQQGTTPWITSLQTSAGVFSQQAGTWSVGLTGLPIQVTPTTSSGVFAQQAGLWSFTLSGQPIQANATTSAGVSATIVGQPVSVSQSGIWTITSITQSVGVFAQQAGTWAVNQGTSPWVVNQTTSIGVNATLVGQVPTINTQDAADATAFTTVPAMATQIAGSGGSSFGTKALLQPINATSLPLQGMTTSTGSEVGLAGRHRQYYGNKVTYGVGMAMGIAAAVAAGTTTDIGYIFHPSTVAQRYQLNRIRVSIQAMSAGTSFNSGNTGLIGEMLIGRITAEAGTPGGVLITALPLDPADAATSATIRRGVTSAPTRAAGFIRDTIVPSSFGYAEYDFNFSDIFEGKPPIMRSGTAEGWEVSFKNIQVVPLGGVSVGCSFTWTEELATAQ